MRIGSSELQKSAKSAQKAQKGSGGDGNLSAVRRKMRVVCVIRVLSGWNVRRKLLERLNGYADFVALAAKSFVS